MKINETTAYLIRSVFCNHIRLHPAWEKKNRAIMEDQFDLEEEQIDALHVLESWIVSHGLEYALGYGDRAPGRSTQDLVQKAYDTMPSLPTLGMSTHNEALLKVRDLLVAAGAHPKERNAR